MAKPQPPVVQPGGRNNRQRRVSPPPPSTHYYQAASSLPIFVDPLDIKILLSHFGRYPTFRTRSHSASTPVCKYVAHMPDGADVGFVEANLGGVAGDAGLKSFEGALKMRTARRKEKVRKDERARVRAKGRERENRDVFSASAPATATWRFAGEASVVGEEIMPAQAVPPEAASSAAAFDVSPAARRQPVEEENEWDMNAAWHELEAKSGGGKKRNKLGRGIIASS
ncbi:hypothetical protein B0H14DRAFT_3649154 [Mycena olivaceomarginata]|nr:hypothetical protein B0H14DRAFT_3649154 [Mycena olivaceomarginata]